MEWKSPRAIAEETVKQQAETRKQKLECFDRLIDMALEGQITVPEAIEAYKFNGEIYAVTAVQEAA